MPKGERGETNQGFIALEQALNHALKLESNFQLRYEDPLFEEKKSKAKADIVKEFEANEPRVLSKENFSLVRKLFEVARQTFGACSLDFPYPLSKLTEIHEKIKQLFLNFLLSKFPEIADFTKFPLDLEKDGSVSLTCMAEPPTKEKEGKEKKYLIFPNLEIKVSEIIAPKIIENLNFETMNVGHE